MSKIKKPSELSATPFLKVLIYGQPGIGKSTLSLSAPEPLMIDCDRGVHRVSSEHLKDTVEVDSWEDIDEVLNEDLGSYQTLIFDTGGKLIDFMTSFLIKKNPKFAQAGGTFSLQGYGARKKMFQDLLGRIHALGKHVIFCAHEREDRDGDDRFVRPEIGGSSGNDLIKELDMVGYMESMDNKRTIHFNPTQKFYAKNSIKLPQSIAIPDAGEKSNVFLGEIIDRYGKTVMERISIAGDYEDMLSQFEEAVSGIETAEDANEIVKSKDSYEHIWDSKLRLATMLKKRAKELGLTYDRKQGQYINPEQSKSAKKTVTTDAEDLGPALTWEDLANDYDAVNTGRPARTLPMDDVSNWALKQEGQYIQSKDGTIHRRK